MKLEQEARTVAIDWLEHMQREHVSRIIGYAVAYPEMAECEAHLLDADMVKALADPARVEARND